MCAGFTASLCKSISNSLLFLPLRSWQTLGSPSLVEILLAPGTNNYFVDNLARGASALLRHSTLLSNHLLASCITLRYLHSRVHMLPKQDTYSMFSSIFGLIQTCIIQISLHRRLPLLWSISCIFFLRNSTAHVTASCIIKFRAWSVLHSRFASFAQLHYAVCLAMLVAVHTRVAALHNGWDFVWRTCVIQRLFLPISSTYDSAKFQWVFN